MESATPVSSVKNQFFIIFFEKHFANSKKALTFADVKQRQ